MRIAVAQTRPVKGNVPVNIDQHKKFTGKAAGHGANLIIFPELSITGYEPSLAQELATTAEDSRFDDFQSISDEKNISIGVGMPVRSEGGTMIGLIIFQPHQPREIYTKHYLHEDEFPFFVAGQNQLLSIERNNNIALAICYELSVPQHAKRAFENGARYYLASVAKTADGIERGGVTLSAIAAKYGMTVLMANCVGHCDNFESAGQSAVWNDKGVLVAQLDEISEGILLFDTETLEVVEETTAGELPASTAG